MGQILAFSFTAMANPTLVAAVTVMLLLPNPKSLMLGYLCGALLTSITIGLVIVFAAQDAGITSSAKHTISPVVDLVLGGVLLAVAVVLHSGRDRSVRERRAEHKREKQAGKPQKTPRWQRELGKGDPRITFAMGVVLTLPGASYLAALTTLAKQDFNTTVTVLVVILINIIMLALLEVPLISYYVAPEQTPLRVERAKQALQSHGRRWLMIGAAVLGSLLVLRGVITSFT
jgi:hypothetical protein